MSGKLEGNVPQSNGYHQEEVSSPVDGRAKENLDMEGATLAHWSEKEINREKEI